MVMATRYFKTIWATPHKPTPALDCTYPITEAGDEKDMPSYKPTLAHIQGIMAICNNRWPGSITVHWNSLCYLHRHLYPDVEAIGGVADEIPGQAFLSLVHPSTLSVEETPHTGRAWR
jgi:hypothetical protein